MNLTGGRSHVVLGAVYLVAGALTLLIGLFAVGLINSFSSTTGDWAELVALLSFFLLGVLLLVAGGLLIAQLGWAHRIAGTGALLVCLVFPASEVIVNLTLRPFQTAAVGVSDVTPAFAVTYNALFALSLLIGAIALLRPASALRWVAVIAVAFMAYSCFELPTAAAVLGLLFSGGSFSHAEHTSVEQQPPAGTLPM
jgi:hypothetical protein